MVRARSRRARPCRELPGPPPSPPTMNLETHDDADLDEVKTVKLKLPKHQHLRLHCLKIITGETMSDIATEALNRYFDDEDIGKEDVL